MNRRSHGTNDGEKRAPEEIIGGMNRVHQYTIMCAPVTAQLAALEALKIYRVLCPLLGQWVLRNWYWILAQLRELALGPRSTPSPSSGSLNSWLIETPVIL